MPACSRWVGLAVALVLAGSGLAGPGLAQVPPPIDGAPVAVEPRAAVLNLTQTGVPAEGTAETGVLAREKALAAGRRAAWERLLADAMTSGPTLSDAQIENMVSSIVIEQERPSPTRYSGRITVNFNGGRVRSTLGSRAPGITAGGAGMAAIGATPAPASNWLEVQATYASMAEWLELLRRLKASGQVASVDIRAIAIDAARLRIGLRTATPEATATLAGSGIALDPVAGPAGQAWHLGLAGGG